MEPLILKGQALKASSLILVGGKAPYYETANGPQQASEQQTTNQELVQHLRILIPDRIAEVQRGEQVQGQYHFPSAGVIAVEASYQDKVVSIKFNFALEMTNATAPAPNMSTPVVDTLEPEAPEISITNPGQIPPEIIACKEDFCVVMSIDSHVIEQSKDVLRKKFLKVFEVTTGADLNAVLERYTPKVLLFDEKVADFSFIFKRIYELPMDLRLKMFVVFITDQYKTGDSKAAFSQSVDLVCKTQDLLSLEQYLPEG